MPFVLALAALAGASPAAATDIDPPWLDAVEELNGALTPEVVEQRAQWVDRRAQLAVIHDLNGPYDLIPRPPATASPGPPAVEVYREAVERWRPLVESFFLPEDVPWAMRVLDCESAGDPLAKNPRSTASGLFQHLASYWPERSVTAGWPGSDVFDPLANVAVAAWLYYMDGPGHWVCR